MAKKAVIWDLDGVVVDTASAHYAAWHELGRHSGIEISEEQFLVTFGQRNEEIIAHFFGPQEKARLEALAAEKEELFRRFVASSVRCFPGVLSLLSSLHENGFAQAIGSSAPLENILLLVETFQLDRFFQAIAHSTDVQKGKPDPEIFLRAAEKLGVGSPCCLVLEDAVAGVQAAKAAKMSCIAITNTRDRTTLREADLVIDSLEDLDVATIDRLISRTCKG